jgi:hypothetical protein
MVKLIKQLYLIPIRLNECWGILASDRKLIHAQKSRRAGKLPALPPLIFGEIWMVILL